ncbi:MAG: glycosyltransferase family 4 protein [Rhodospirillaceae bacterium]
MRQGWFAFPGDLNAPTGGYGYARRMLDALPDCGWALEPLALPDGFPAPEGPHIATALDQLRAIPKGALVLLDGLAFGGLPATELANLPATLVVLHHHPLALETGLTQAEATRLHATEKAALGIAQAVIVTSPDTARTLVADYAVPEGKITIALPGTDPAPTAPGFSAPDPSGTDRAPVLLSVATLTPRKGHDVLLEALDRLRDLPWTAQWIGSLDRDRPCAQALQAAITERGLAERITCPGAVTGADLQAAYQAAALFVLPSRHEGYGMAFAEALSYGLPVIGCAVGAVPDTVPAEAGILVPPDDPDALEQALRAFLVDPARRLRTAQAARQAGLALPSWQDCATTIAACLTEVMTEEMRP